MSKMYNSLFFVLCFPVLAYSITCHRCFGNGFCHDPEHSDWGEGIRNATCGTSGYWGDIGDSEDPFLSEVEKVLNAQYDKTFQNISAQETEIEYNCMTATVFELYDSYTLRTCVSRIVPVKDEYPTLCEQVLNVIQTQNFYNGSLSCRQCSGKDFCNEHLLREEDGLTETGSAIMQLGSASIVSLLCATLSLLALRN